VTSPTTNAKITSRAKTKEASLFFNSVSILLGDGSYYSVRRLR